MGRRSRDAFGRCPVTAAPLTTCRTRIRSLITIVCVLAACVADPVASQVCAGSLPFANGYLRVSGSAETTTGAHGFDGGMTFGGAARFFGLRLGTTHFDAFNGSSIDAGLVGGYELPLDQRGRLQLCPILTVGHVAGPNNTPYGDFFETDLIASLQLGAVAMHARALRLIPTAGLGFEYSQQGFSGFAGSQPIVSHGFGVLALGLGLVFGNTVTLRPDAELPIGLANGDARYALVLAVNVGH